MGGGDKWYKDPLTYIAPPIAGMKYGMRALDSGGVDASAVAAGGNPYESALAKMSMDAYGQTDPLRQNLIGQMGNLLSGGFDPQKSPLYGPMYAAARSGPEAQYGVAKENILANTPRGGGQIEALANLEGARASEVGAIPGMISNNILSDMLNKTYGVAFGNPQTSMSGLGTAAQLFGNRQAAATLAGQQQQNALYGGLGTMAGMGLGTAIAGPLGGKMGAGAGKTAGSGMTGK